MAADVVVTQRGGFVDLELRDDRDAAVQIRTEAGLQGRIMAPLLAAQSRHWRVILAPRRGKGPGSVALSLSMLRPATDADRLKSAAFRNYVAAENLRFANYRETTVTARPADITARPRGAYEAALTQYAQAGDACGARRARIGLARMEVALENYPQGRAAAQSAATAACDGDFAEQAQAFKTIGMAAAYEGDFTASIEAAERALALYARTGDLRYQGIVRGNLSAVYMQIGATDRALAAAEGALRAAEDTADGQGVVFSRKSIADIHLARGELALALRDYRSTLANLRDTPYPMIEGETWDDLGIVYHRLADYQESLKAYEAAGAVWRKMGRRAGQA